MIIEPVTAEITGSHFPSEQEILRLISKKMGNMAKEILQNILVLMMNKKSS